jgi:hypothetical protein
MGSLEILRNLKLHEQTKRRFNRIWVIIHSCFDESFVDDVTHLAGVQASLHIPRLILRVLKLTII